MTADIASGRITAAFIRDPRHPGAHGTSSSRYSGQSLNTFRLAKTILRTRRKFFWE
jgi:hypothetical protein